MRKIWFLKTDWFYYSFWLYLLEKPLTWNKFWCRAKLHPKGPIYYNVNGVEPNWKCKDCGDYLG